MHLAFVDVVIACNHPTQGLCQHDKRRGYVEITRHFRDDVARTLDMRFDEAVLPGVATSATDPSADGRRTPTKNAIAY